MIGAKNQTRLTIRNFRTVGLAFLLNLTDRSLNKEINMADENNVQITETHTAQEPEKTFTQADMDAAIQKRLDRERKKYPSEEELNAFRTWKESQQTEKERWDNLTKERDTARTELTAVQSELEQYRQEKFLLSKGVPAGDVDYYAFKIGKLVTDTTDFETAAEAYLKEHAPKEQDPAPGRMRVQLGAPLGGGNPPPMSINEIINNKLRGR